MERKLAAIVAADVANYSLLLGRNELGTLTELKRVQDELIDPAIHHYRGRIVRLMGDGSLLSFDSALNAVKFAVDVQREMVIRKINASSDVQINFRMGVNLGDIVEDRQDIHGEGINVAVRLEELAPPGGVCLSHSIYLQAKHVLGEDLTPIGERQLKHIADPILVWRWQPPGNPDGEAVCAAPHAPERHAHGRQILDPKVTALLVDLHLRSARLALCEAFDEMLARPDGGRRLSLRDIHRLIGEKLDTAAELLLPVSVERKPEPPRRARGGAGAQSFSEFLSRSFDGGDMFLAFGLLRRIQTVLRSQAPIPEKRAALVKLSRHLIRETEAPRIKDAIRFAFVDA